MADVLTVISASAKIHTGKGQLTGVIISVASTSSTGLATFYDNTSAAGTKILEVHVPSVHPLVVFFAERFAPRFATGLYLSLAANMTATVWSVQL
jgi:hypothetical protein